MACLTCEKSDSWHRSRIEHLERTVGPEAGLEFEQHHPEETDDLEEQKEEQR